MKWGLRVQLLLLLGVLMVASYVPLFFATSTYTRIGLERLQRDNAIKLARSVAAHLTVLRRQTDDSVFLDLARAQIDGQSVHALSLIRRSGKEPIILGEFGLLKTLAAESDFGTNSEVRQLRTSKGPAILVYEPGPRGGVAAVVRADPEITHAETLATMMGLYMAVGGIALLAAAYFALTRWIVRPILELSRSADRIVAGGHRIEPLSRAPREISNLSLRLAEMTERLRSEEDTLRGKVEELTTLTTELSEAQASLVRSERLATVGRLAAGLAHEVGNPISALMGFQDLMIEGGLSDAENKDFLQRMSRETARIHRVLSDLLAYARPGGDRSPRGDSGGSGSLSFAIEDALALLTPQGDLKEMSLSSEVEEGLGHVPLSPEELTQIMLNLLMNAADACGRKGRIVVTARKIAQEKVELSVEDDGPGIDPEVRESLFEPFVSTKEVGKGTGLGLAVTKGLVESAEGSIRVEEGQWGGARFVIELPELV